MSDIPLVSIITPVFNREKYISYCIDSILKQTYKYFEYIIVDDGSNDHTIDIINKYSEQDNRIKVISNLHNLGAPKSYNKGVMASKGQYIMRLDSDDIAFPKRIEKQIAYLKKNKKTFAVGTGSELIDENGIKYRTKKFPTKYHKIKKIFEYTNGIFNSSVMMNLELINYDKKLILLDPVIYPADDFYMWKNIIFKNLIVENIKDILHKHRVHPGSESLNNSLEQGYKTLLSAKLFSKKDNNLNIKNFIDGKNVLFDKLPESLKPTNLEIIFFTKSYYNHVSVIENIKQISYIINLPKSDSSDLKYKFIIVFKLILKLLSLTRRNIFGKSS